jgi:tetratricopeptide (TPR) repeat protein
LCWKTFLVQKAGGAVMDTANFSFASRLDNVFVSYVRYPAKMFWPVNLTALNMRIGGWQPWQVAGAVILLAAFTAWIVFQAGKRPWLAMGWFWYLGTLVPVIGLVQVGMQSLADRYTYLPMIGLFIILAWGGAELAARFRPPKYVPVLAAALSLGACLLVAARQIPWWKNSETLFYKMLAVNDKNYIAHYNLGNLYNRRGQFDLAATNYLQALAVEPNFADVHNNFANLLLNHQQYDGAILHYQEAARIKPSATAWFNLANTFSDAANSRHDTNLFAQALLAYQQSITLDPNYADPHNNLGNLLLTWQQFDEAIRQFQEAVRLKPSVLTWFNLANTYADTARARHDTNLFAQSISAFQQCLQVDPNYADAHNNLGMIFQEQGRGNLALDQFQAAVSAKPGSYLYHFNLANALAQANRLDEAIAHFQTAARLNPARPESFTGQGLCYARQGKMEDAAVQFRKVIALAPRDPGAYDHLGNSLGSEGKYDEAIAAFVQALQLNPADCEAEFDLGLTYLHLNRRDDARTHFQAALRLQPDFSAARQALSELDQPPK